MDCDYLLMYGEWSRKQRYKPFHATTPEEAEEMAERIVEEARERSEIPGLFNAKLYREIKEW